MSLPSYSLRQLYRGTEDILSTFKASTRRQQGTSWRHWWEGRICIAAEGTSATCLKQGKEIGISFKFSGFSQIPDQNVWDFLSMFGIFRDLFSIFENFEDFPRMFGFFEIFRIFQDFLGFFENF
jgi:hypothetical protein